MQLTLLHDIINTLKYLRWVVWDYLVTNRKLDCPLSVDAQRLLRHPDLWQTSLERVEEAKKERKYAHSPIIINVSDLIQEVKRREI